MSKYSRLEMIDFLNERMRPLKWLEWQMVTWDEVDKWCELLGFGSRLTPREPDNGDSAPSQAFSQPEFLSDLEGLS